MISVISSLRRILRRALGGTVKALTTIYSPILSWVRRHRAQSVIEQLEWPIGVFASIALASAFLVGLWILIVARFAGTAEWQFTLWMGVVGLLGVAASLFGVRVAIQIYKQQQESEKARAEDLTVVLNAVGEDARAASESAEKAAQVAIEQRELIDAVLDRDDQSAMEIAAAVKLDADEKKAIRRVDPFPDEGAFYDVPPIPVTFGGKPGNFYELPAVPIGVLGDLTNYWRENDHSGAWPIGYLLGAFRQAGNGRNYPWVLLFEKPNGDRKAWRLFRGGRGRKDETLVTEIEPDLLKM